MPILEVHLVEGMHTSTQHADLLRAISVRFAEVLEAPVERVRAYLTLHRPEHWAVGGEPGRTTPYFTVVVLEGRSAEQRRRLLGALTDIIVDVLGVDRRDVRGRIKQVPPDDWGIGGVPASAIRRDEIAARSTS